MCDCQPAKGPQHRTSSAEFPNRLLDMGMWPHGVRDKGDFLRNEQGMEKSDSSLRTAGPTPLAGPLHLPQHLLAPPSLFRPHPTLARDPSPCAQVRKRPCAPLYLGTAPSPHCLALEYVDHKYITLNCQCLIPHRRPGLSICWRPRPRRLTVSKTSAPTLGSPRLI